MLSSEDLSEIQKIVQTETTKAVESKTGSVIEKAVTPIKKDMQTLKSDMTRIRKDIKTIVNFFDTEYLDLRKRVERIEEHLNLTPISN